MPLKTLFRDALRTYRKEGAVHTAKAALVVLYRFVSGGFRPSEYQTDYRIDADQRWEMMKEHVSSQDSNLLDIGCADGELTKRFSELGLFCLGLDISERRIAQARKKERLDNSVRFLRHETTPETIDDLPTFDITLLLTVYQHWGRQYGWEASEEMLRQLAAHTNTLIFEPHPNILNRQPFDENVGDSVVEYYEQYLDAILDGEVEIEYLGMAEYQGDERRDPVFVLNCREFDLG